MIIRSQVMTKIRNNDKSGLAQKSQILRLNSMHADPPPPHGMMQFKHETYFKESTKIMLSRQIVLKASK